MIRLLINNEEALIEAESNIEIIRKNPFFFQRRGFDL